VTEDGEKAKLAMPICGPRTGVAVGVSDRTGLDVAVSVAVADAVALAVKVALGTPVTEAVAERTGDAVLEAVAVALGTVGAVAVNVDVIVGMGVTVASSTMVVPVMPADAEEV